MRRTFFLGQINLAHTHTGPTHAHTHTKDNKYAHKQMRIYPTLGGMECLYCTSLP